MGSNGISAFSFGKQPAWCPLKCACSENYLSANCRFLRLKVIPSELPKFLRILDLTGNQITGIPNNTFVNLHNLTQLTLSNNTIVKIEEDAFNGLKNLRELYLEGNRLSIETLETSTLFEGLNKLETLLLGKNQLKFLYENSFKSGTLRKLNLEDNNLVFRENNTETFRQMVGIQRIYLSSCRFDQEKSNVPELIFQNLTSLEMLSVSNSRLTSLGAHGLRGLPNLYTLQLNNLRLTELHKETFAGLYSLKKLNLMGNQIRVVNSSSFPAYVLRNISELNLGGNPFDCSCKLFWFMDWAK
ncbi:hypothetical protein CAPTEDRAFT_118823, partial [Capitella teleta]